MWRCDAGRTAATSEELPEQMHLQWVRHLPRPVAGWPASQYKLQFDASYEPVVMGKLMFVPSMMRDSVTAYDTETGEFAWRFFTEGPVRFAPVAQDGKVWFVSDDGYLYCVKADDGSLLWKFRGGPADRRVIGNHRLVSMWPARGGPVLYDGTIYFAASIWPFMGIFIHALDAETGEVVWTNSGSGSIYILQQHDSPAFAGVAPQGYIAATEEVLLVSGGRTVPAAYDRKTGQFLYYHVSSRQFGNDAGGYAVTALGDWFFNGGAMYRVSDGAGLLLAPGFYTPDIIYRPNRETFSAISLTLVPVEEDNSKKLMLQEKWRVALDPSPEQIFLKAARRLYGGRDDGTVMAINLVEGGTAAVSWTGEVQGSPWSMLAADGKLFVVTKEGGIYCFGPGEREAEVYPNPERQLPVTDNEWKRRVAEILKDTDVKGGYCLVLGVGSGKLIEELFKQSDLDIVVSERDAAKVQAFRERWYDVPGTPRPSRIISARKGQVVEEAPPSVEVEWPREWQVLGPFPKGSAGLPSDALRTIPTQWTIGDETYTTRPLATVGGVLDFSHLYGGYGYEALEPGQNPVDFPHDQTKRDTDSVEKTAYAFAKINCPTDGRLTIGAAADWWMAWALDGKPIYDTLEQGNVAYPFSTANHIFTADLSAGEHVLAVMVKAGSGSWVMHSDSGRAVERMLATTESAAGSALPRRVFVLQGDALSLELPPYFADLIMSEEAGTLGVNPDREDVHRLFDLLHPYGGMACLPKEKIAEVCGDLENAQVSEKEGLVMLKRVGPLAGAAAWTHQYADSANSVISKDKRVKAPLGLLWFGGPSNDNVLPRHGHGPSPQVIGGRLFIEGADMLRAVDVYTGKLLWEREMPGFGKYYDNTNHQPGANEIGSNYVSVEDGVYVIMPDSCLCLDPATGRSLKEYVLPSAREAGKAKWGFIAVLGDLLVATASPVTVPTDDKPPDEGETAAPALKDVSGVNVNADYAAASKSLVIINRHSGDILWTRSADYCFRHNTIIGGGTKIFCIDKMTDKKTAYLRRRGYVVEQKPTLYAFDALTGDVLWEKSENVFGTWLGYSEEHDILLQAGSAARDRATDEVGQGLVAYNGSDGTILWESGRRYSGPCMIHHGTVITQGDALDLLTGKPRNRVHPMTGRTISWNFDRQYGCNTIIGSEHLLTFRSAAAGFYDLINDYGTGNLGGFKSGCTSNLIAADGVLNAPDYTRTCTCSYQNQSSLALIHDPEVEVWTFSSINWRGRRVQRVGINFGAPGDRLAESGVLWLDYPSVGGRSPDIPVSIEGERPSFFRHHTSLLDREGLPWVAASGVEGCAVLKISLSHAEEPAQAYTVRLHFAEPNTKAAEGDRVFDVSLQGRLVLEDFDVVEAAGATRRAIVCEFKDIQITKDLTIGFKSQTGKPLLNGIEVAANDD